MLCPEEQTTLPEKKQPYREGDDAEDKGKKTQERKVM